MTNPTKGEKKQSDSAGGAKAVFEKIKQKATKVYATSSKMVDEVTQATQEYTERYKHNVEMKKLGEKRDVITAKLGMTAFEQFKSSNKLPEKFLNQKDITDQIKEIEKLDKQIVKIGKKLEKGKK
jgi:hypothetical protein